jgi:hypothetical protein
LKFGIVRALNGTDDGATEEGGPFAADETADLMGMRLPLDWEAEAGTLVELRTWQQWE